MLWEARCLQIMASEILNHNRGRADFSGFAIVLLSLYKYKQNRPLDVRDFHIEYTNTYLGPSSTTPDIWKLSRVITDFSVCLCVRRVFVSTFLL